MVRSYLSAVSMLLLVFTSNGARAQTAEPAPDVNPNEVFRLIQEAKAEMNPAILEIMKVNVQELHSAPEVGFKQMSEEEKQSTFLTCVTGKGAIYMWGRLGLCLDGNKRAYTLSSIGGGLSLGSSGSLIFGIVKSSNGSIRGEYTEPTISAGRTWLKLGKTLTRLNAGVGVDVLFGRSKSGNTLVLVGPKLGAMFDLSVQTLTLD